MLSGPLYRVVVRAAVLDLGWEHVLGCGRIWAGLECVVKSDLDRVRDGYGSGWVRLGWAGLGAGIGKAGRTPDRRLCCDHQQQAHEVMLLAMCRDCTAEHMS